MRLGRSFYERDVLDVAPDLIGKMLLKNTHEGCLGYMITEVEAYRGSEDEASHARFGKTSRNAIMFSGGGRIYMYFIYGMYWMLNIVTGTEGNPQAVLLRGIQGYNGPGKVTRALGIDKSYYGIDLVKSDQLWIEDHHIETSVLQKPRVGIGYASEPWKSNPWRYLMAQPPQIV